MNPRTQALHALRHNPAASTQAGLGSLLGEQLAQRGVGFAASSGVLQQRWHQALAELQNCLRPLAGSEPVLNEGGVYAGTWIESTGTINTEVLSRFAPDTATQTLSIFAQHQRQDGLIPYKVAADGPAFSQIQIVTPLARSVWNHYWLHHNVPETHGVTSAWLRQMYEAMTRYDHWLATYRDTRGTGCVEAFCTFDTGHDLSPRFWFAPERCHHLEASSCDPEAPGMPYLAPDLTAHTACQRTYLARIAEELGEDPHPWRQKAEQSLTALFTHCYDPTDGTFYDVDAAGNQVRVTSDVLLRVLACEVGDTAFFEAALQRYLMNTAQFLSHYGFTSISLSDPRYDGDHTRNSWAGPVNFLTQLRAPHAFDHYNRPTELAVVQKPILTALARANRFPQCLDPWSGDAGFTTEYSPAILWLLDAVERSCGILPLPSGGLAFTGLAPTRLDHGAAAEATAYSRTVHDQHFELAADEQAATTWCDGQFHMQFPRGWRVTTDNLGRPTGVIGMAPHRVDGELEYGGHILSLSVMPNQHVTVRQMTAADSHMPGFTAPRA